MLESWSVSQHTSLVKTHSLQIVKPIVRKDPLFKDPDLSFIS